MKEIKIRSLNISEKKGTIKDPVPVVHINETGVAGDAHAGYWHRQVSLLAVESLKKAEEQNNRSFKFGDFGENITTEGIELHKTHVMDRFQSGEVVLEVTQIGKKCHSGCEIMNQTGKCIMPVEGIFCRVISGGALSTDDVLYYQPKEVRGLVITLSDRAYNGIYDDKSGPYASKMISSFFKEFNRPCDIVNKLIPDDEKLLQDILLEAVQAKTDIIITTGGTGIGKRDITPDVVKKMLDKEIPGIMEHIRVKYGASKPNALLSRSIAGVIDDTLIYVLPGNVKAVNEYLTEITPTLEHSMRMLAGIDAH